MNIRKEIENLLNTFKEDIPELMEDAVLTSHPMLDLDLEDRVIQVKNTSEALSKPHYEAIIRMALKGIIKFYIFDNEEDGIEDSEEEADSLEEEGPFIITAYVDHPNSELVFCKLAAEIEALQDAKELIYTITTAGGFVEYEDGNLYRKPEHFHEIMIVKSSETEGV
jgi:hypothetical protein